MAGLAFYAAVEELDPGIDFAAHFIPRYTLAGNDLNPHRVVAVLIEPRRLFGMTHERLRVGRAGIRVADKAGFRRAQSPQQSEIRMINLRRSPVTGGEAGELFRRPVAGITLSPLKTILETYAELITGSRDFFGIMK